MLVKTSLQRVDSAVLVVTNRCDGSSDWCILAATGLFGGRPFAGCGIPAGPLRIKIAQTRPVRIDAAVNSINAKKLPLLRHYILVSQTAWVLEWFRRDEAGHWNYEVLSDSANVLKIPNLNLRLPLSDVYDDPNAAPLLPAPESEKP